MSQTRGDRSWRYPDLGSIRWARWQSRWSASVRFKRARRRSGERARHRRQARNQRREVALKRLFGLGHVAGTIFETGEFFEERERDFADGTVALFCDNEFRFAGFFGARFFVFFI